jgi:hypothetical protein
MNTLCVPLCGAISGPGCSGSSTFCYSTQTTGWGYCVETCIQDGGYFIDGGLNDWDFWISFNDCMEYGGDCEQMPDGGYGCFP